MAFICAIILARCNLAAQLKRRASVNHLFPAAASPSFRSSAFAFLFPRRWFLPLSSSPFFFLPRDHLPLDTHTLGRTRDRCFSFHSTGIIAKPQRLFLRQVHSCVSLRSFAVCELMRNYTRRSKPLSRARTSSQIALRVRGTFALPHICTVDSPPVFQTDRNASVRAGESSGERANKSERTERKGEKVMESL